MNQFIKHQFDSKSVGDIENQQQQSTEEDYGIQYRKYSLPGGIDDQTRKIISQFVILRVIELGFNVGLANQILDSINPDEFVVDADHRVLNMVIQSLILIEQYADTTDYHQQRTIYHQFRELVGSKNPNLMSYLGYNRRHQNELSQSESLLPQYCLICFSQIGQLEENNSDCEHTFCSDCFHEYCRQRIMNGQADQMTCPYDGCPIQISDNTIRTILGNEMHDKMIKFRKIKQLATNTDIKWCPRQECEEFVKVVGKKKKLKCACGQLICRLCGREYHPDESCNQQLDKDFKKAIKELNIQKCPKCRSPIQKSDGCNHMTCKHCSYEFCWLCRSKFSSKHYSSINIFGCPGMQFSYRDPFRYPNLYRIMFLLALICFGPPLVVIGVILGLIIAIIGLPVFAYMSCVPSHQFAEYGCCRKLIIIILLQIACIALSPISFLLVCLAIVVGIIVGIPYAIYLLIEWIRD